MGREGSVSARCWGRTRLFFRRVHVSTVYEQQRARTVSTLHRDDHFMGDFFSFTLHWIKQHLSSYMALHAQYNTINQFYGI